jgi:hypothetical protein
MESNECKAFQIIHDAKLAHPESPLVQSFILDAKDCDAAARYLLQSCADDTHGVEFARFVQD